MTMAAILAGGRGMRMGGSDAALPKPLTQIGNRPIIEHLMRYLVGQGIEEFVIALGHNAGQLEEYFAAADLPCTIKLVDTGVDTATGGRVRRLAPHLGAAPFFLTWCDGLYDIDIAAFQAFHRSHGGLASIVTVNPKCRFGVLDLDGDKVLAMREKPVLTDLWINAGLFLIDPGVIEYVKGDASSWETNVMPALAVAGQMSAWRHTGFWQCMDTPADAKILNTLWQSGSAPWIGLH